MGCEFSSTLCVFVDLPWLAQVAEAMKPFLRPLRRIFNFYATGHAWDAPRGADAGAPSESGSIHDASAVTSSHSASHGGIGHGISRYSSVRSAGKDTGSQRHTLNFEAFRAAMLDLGVAGQVRVCVRLLHALVWDSSP
jgi:hypothetical protein